MCVGYVRAFDRHLNLVPSLTSPSFPPFSSLYFLFPFLSLLPLFPSSAYFWHKVLADVDEEFVCYRYVNLATNEEISIIPKSGIIVDRDPPKTTEEPDLDMEMLDLESTSTLQQRTSEEDEISDALKDVDEEFQQITKTKTKTELTAMTNQMETNTNPTTDEQITKTEPAETTIPNIATETNSTNVTKDINTTNINLTDIYTSNITTETNSTNITNTAEINKTNAKTITEKEAKAEEMTNDGEILLAKKPFYKRRHFNQLFVKGDNVVYVCEDLPITSRNFREQCKSKYTELLYSK